jgi:hypothetical protein
VASSGAQTRSTGAGEISDKAANGQKPSQLGHVRGEEKGKLVGPLENLVLAHDQIEKENLSTFPNP